MEKKKITDYNFEKNDSLFYFKNVLKNTGWKVFYKIQFMQHPLDWLIMVLSRKMMI